MPPEGKIPQHKADFPLGNVNLRYLSKKAFISKPFISRALDPKGSLLYFYKSHFLPQSLVVSKQSCYAAFCSHHCLQKAAPAPGDAWPLPAPFCLEIVAEVRAFCQPGAATFHCFYPLARANTAVAVVSNQPAPPPVSFK